MSTRRKVHIVDSSGRPYYNRLWDSGSEVLRFDSACGWVVRRDVVRNGWQIRDGWVTDAEWVRAENERNGQ